MTHPSENIRDAFAGSAPAAPNEMQSVMPAPPEGPPGQIPGDHVRSIKGDVDDSKSMKSVGDDHSAEAPVDIEALYQKLEAFQKSVGKDDVRCEGCRNNQDLRKKELEAAFALLKKIPIKESVAKRIRERASTCGNLQGTQSSRTSRIGYPNRLVTAPPPRKWLCKRRTTTDTTKEANKKDHEELLDCVLDLAHYRSADMKEMASGILLHQLRDAKEEHKIAILKGLITETSRSACDLIDKLLVPANFAEKGNGPVDEDDEKSGWQGEVPMICELMTIVAPHEEIKAGAEHEPLEVCQNKVVDTYMFYLVNADMARAELKVLRDIPPHSLRHQEILEALRLTPNSCMLSTQVAETILSVAWSQYRLLTGVDAACSFMVVIVLVVVSTRLRNDATVPDWAITLLSLLLGKRLLDGMLTLSPATFTQSWTRLCRVLLAEWLYLVLGFDSVSQMAALATNNSDSPRFRFALFSAVSWLHIIYALRGESWCGPRLIPIFMALRDTFVFFLVLAVCTAAAVHFYYILALGDHPYELVGSIVYITRLAMFGDFDLFELEGSDPVYKSNEEGHWEPEDPSPGNHYASMLGMFYLVGVGITLLLMNLLIGVLGKNYELYEGRAKELFHRERADMLLRISLRARPWRMVRERCGQERCAEDRVWVLARESG